jgi:hypothetical protein
LSTERSLPGSVATGWVMVLMAISSMRIRPDLRRRIY